MTLKEKIAVELINSLPVNVIEQLSDKFAKEVLRAYIENETLQYKQKQGDYSLNELLEIIKKEKGL